MTPFATLLYFSETRTHGRLQTKLIVFQQKPIICNYICSICTNNRTDISRGQVRPKSTANYKCLASQKLMVTITRTQFSEIQFKLNSRSFVNKTSLCFRQSRRVTLVKTLSPIPLSTTTSSLLTYITADLFFFPRISMLNS